MKTERNENHLIIFLEGRIDTGNAADIEKEIVDAMDANEGATPVFDASGLNYISSAGLRVLMKIRKGAGSPIEVREVSPEVYEIFETTGFTDLLDVKKRLRKVSIDGCEKIGEGGNGTVYRLDEDQIVKVYKPWMAQADVDLERSFAKTAFVNGVPSVITYDTVRVGDCLGVVFEMLHSDTLGHAIAAHPEKMTEYVDQYVALAKELHSTHVPANSFDRIQDVYHKRADNLGKWCTPEEISMLHGIIDSIPDADTVTHNDLHPGNIMIQDGELVLIDMQEVTVGPPITDLTSVYRDMIVAPTSDSEVIEKTIGMPRDMITQVGNLFFMKYTGITDPAELEAYYKKLGLLFAVNTVLVVGSGSEGATSRADGIMERLLHPVVVPNVQAICGLYKTM